jgi:hypothetical protein
MQNPEPIMRFTRAAAMMKDPPMLPMALWFGTVPALAVFGWVHPLGGLFSFFAAVLAAVLGSRWFKRTYGVVTPSADSFPGRVQAGGGFALIVVAVLEALSNAARLPVRLGMIAYGAWLIRGAHVSKGLRPHLYVLGAICVGVAFVPLVIGQTLRDDSMLGGTIIVTAFGLGWAYVCIQDYRALRRNLGHLQHGAAPYPPSR